jgi:O-antigen ligase
VLFFLIWTVALDLREANPSSILRSVVWTSIQFAVPYIVIRRHLKGYALAFSALSFAVFSQAILGAVESVLRWHIHTEIQGLMDSAAQFQGMYKYRWGFLRAQASFMNPLMFSLFASMAFLCSIIIFLRIGVRPTARRSRMMALVAIGVALLGTLSTVSRSGIVGAVLIGVILGVLLWALQCRPDPKAKLVTLALTVGSATYFLFSDFFAQTFDYRVRLLEIGVELILMYPIFGQVDPAGHPMMEELIQGEGIVDLVNQYVAIGLTAGLAGLGLFVYSLVACLNRLYAGLRGASGEERMIGVFVFVSLALLAFNLFASSAFAWSWNWIFILMAVASNVVARLEAPGSAAAAPSNHQRSEPDLWKLSG